MHHHRLAKSCSNFDTFPSQLGSGELIENKVLFFLNSSRVVLVSQMFKKNTNKQRKMYFYFFIA